MDLNPLDWDLHSCEWTEYKLQLEQLSVRQRGSVSSQKEGWTGIL